MLAPWVSIGLDHIVVSLHTNSTWIWTGPLVLVAVLYEIIGGLIAWIIKQFFWVPHRFRYGILVAGVFGNVGDIRELCSIIHSSHLNVELLFRSYLIATAVIMSVTGATPFQGTNDQNLSVAYISAFILVFMVCLTII